jgi:hypothetical protein
MDGKKDGKKKTEGRMPPLMLDQRIRRQGRRCMLHVFFLISPKFLTGVARGLEQEFLRAALVVRLSLGLLFLHVYDEKKVVWFSAAVLFHQASRAGLSLYGLRLWSAAVQFACRRLRKINLKISPLSPS